MIICLYFSTVITDATFLSYELSDMYLSLFYDNLDSRVVTSILAVRDLAGQTPSHGNHEAW